ncbi:MAG: hypothetical protein IKX23_02025 [Treponema sp.]|nr:hypothetical protein [Treponema sp.]
MNVFKRVLLLTCIIGCFTFTGCETGLGEEIDLEAPVLTITSPEKFSYQPLNFILRGTCSDNKGVTKVVVSNKESGKVYGNAVISGNDWQFEMNLVQEEEGEITFLCSAYDEFGNSSTKSARNITLLVDEHAPEGSGWYVERGNNKPVNLKDKEYLENLDYTLSVNKDVPQNETVYIHASFYDAMNIDTITIKLYEDGYQTPKLQKTVTARPSDINYIGEGKSMYSPVFMFTHSEFSAAGLGTGKHYMRVKYYSKDNDSADNYNENEGDTEAYFLWWPESDKPNFQINNIVNGELSVSVGSSIPLDIFDDDGLSEYYAALTDTSVNYSEATIISNASTRTTIFGGTSTEAHPIVKRTSFPNKITQQDSPSITAPGTPTQMYLYVAAKDAKENGGTEKWNCRRVSVKVTDTSKPLLFIESPQQNTIPEIAAGGSGTSFKITGYSLDSKGSDFVKIIYIPDDPSNSLNNTAEKKSERAKALFTQYESDTTAKKVISGTNEVIWYKKLGTAQDQGTWKKQLFEISMELLSDFKNKNGTSTAKETKYFEIFLRDQDGNDVNKPFIVLGDNIRPGIDIISPNKQLAVHNFEENDLTIQFKASKDSGLGIDTSKYKVTTKIGSQNYQWVVKSGEISVNATTGVGTLTIPKATLKTWTTTESQPTFTFYATDKLGNGGEGEGERTVILSTNPAPVAITVDKGEGTYKQGDILRFKVTFTKQVKVTGTPKLRLKYSNSDSTFKYAAYESGSGSNTLQFKFTVPEGAESQKLLCTGFDTTSENVLSGGATIKATELGENNIFTSMSGVSIFSDTKTIKLDGVSPVINSVSVVAADGNNYCTKDKVIRATVKFSEAVRIEGSPALILKVNNTNVSFTFENWNEDEIVFKHSVTTSDPEGTLKWAASYAFTSPGLIKDSPGNSLSLSGNASGNSSVVIDYTAPTSAPTITPAAGTYNEEKTIALSNIESGGTGYFSKDGGISWTGYSSATNAQKTLGNGSYDLMSYQEDKAGNKSANSAKQTVTINNLFPDVSNFGIDLPDGYYNAGTTVKFAIDFNDQIKVNNATDLVLTFASNTNSSLTQTVNVTVPSGNESSHLEFSYTVGTTDNFNGVVIKEIAFADSVTDHYGNKPAFSTTPKKLTPTNCAILNSTAGGKRTGVVLDGVAPTISTYSPVNNAISSITNNANFKVTLTFNENVFKETGYIILQRKGDWAIPAVMTNDEFLKYYNKMSAANKTIVRKMGSDGDDLKHGRTGIEVGPYRRITHGLKVDGSYYVPDTDTKFVLAYDLGLYSGSASLNDGTDSGTFTVTVAQIRSALESVGYHQHKVDVASDYVTITGNKVEITFPEAIEDGREWDLIIPATAFRDNAENFFGGITAGSYSFWSNNVAKPVVRVDRYTHGWGAHEPNADGSAYTDITKNQGKYKNANPAANTSAAIAPTGYVRARIDCETPAVTIKYSKLGINGTAWTSTAPAGVAYNAAGGTTTTGNASGTYTYTRQILADITTANINKRGATTYVANSDIIVGDGNYTAARKDYITAYATKSGFTDSANGYEGIFKTIVYITSSNQARIINIEGGTAPGGQSCVFGFPLKDATDENDSTNAGRYSKNCYVVDGNTRKNFVFVSYEILSKDWAVLICNANHSRVYPLNDYGGSVYVTAMTYY